MYNFSNPIKDEHIPLIIKDFNKIEYKWHNPEVVVSLGYFNWTRTNYNSKRKPNIKILVNSNFNKFPFICKGFKNYYGEEYLEKEFKNNEEVLLTTIAHELYHYKQFKDKTAYKEKDADTYAIKKLDEWRTIMASSHIQPFQEKLYEQESYSPNH